MWVTDFQAADKLIAVDVATCVHSDKFRSPMGVGLSAYSSKDKAAEMALEIEGRIVSWSIVESIVSKTWSLDAKQPSQPAPTQ
jgi:hypothetical protein